MEVMVTILPRLNENKKWVACITHNRTYLMPIVIGEPITCMVYRRPYDLSSMEKFQLFLRNTHGDDLCSVIYSSYIYTDDITSMTEADALIVWKRILEEAKMGA